MPAYPQALGRAHNVREIMRLGHLFGMGETRLLAARLPEGELPVWLVDCPSLYNRVGGPYQDLSGRDWDDNHLRFALLAHVAAALANEVGGRWRPDIIHANDWHAGLIPALVSSSSPKKPPVVFTVHNLAYQGLFHSDCFDDLGLPRAAFSQLEYYGKLSFLKAGIQAADVVTTVSPTYAKEILSPEHGCGLDGVLRARPTPPIGILNGIDRQLWNPERDPFIPATYSAHAMRGKVVCKQILQAELGLEQTDIRPIVAYTSRLTHQKMPDIVLEALPTLLADGVQFALVAEGAANYETSFQAIAERYPKQVAIKIGYQEEAAHRLIAGADILLHPARFEPCGLVPLYAMRYGTVPVVRHCGGLADSIVGTVTQTIADGTATGFLFNEPSAAAMIASVRRAVMAFREPSLWRKISTTGMTIDSGWSRAAGIYDALYRSLTGCPINVETPHADTDLKALYA